MADEACTEDERLTLFDQYVNYGIRVYVLRSAHTIHRLVLEDPTSRTDRDDSAHDPGVCRGTRDRGGRCTCSIRTRSHTARRRALLYLGDARHASARTALCRLLRPAACGFPDSSLCRGRGRLCNQ